MRVYLYDRDRHDLRRLRLHGLIERQARDQLVPPHSRRHRVAVLYTELHARLLGPLLEAGEAVDRMGRVSVPISPGVPGEAYTAYTQAEEPLAVNTRVVVVQQPSSRTVLVTTS